MFRIISFLFIFLIPTVFWGQSDDVLSDLQAIKNGSITFYNLGAYSITTETYSSEFSDKKLKKVLKKYKVLWKKKEVPLTDSLVKKRNYKFLQEIKEGTYINKYAVYAVENNLRTSIVTFSKIGELDSKLMSSFINSFTDSGFDKNIYAEPKIDSIRFVNRFIKLGPGCQWMGVRNVQCPYNGQMDWTIHKSMEEVNSYNEIRSNITKSEKQLKLLSEEIVDINFEGKKAKAKKLVLDVKGFNSLLLNLQSGAKNLIVYYVASEVGDKYVSCILSHWDNDRMQANGLPALLGEVMELEKK